MVDEKIIEASTNSLKSLDDLGTVSLTVFFVFVILGIVLFVLRFMVKDFSTVVKNNTEALKDLSNSMSRDFSDIKSKQILIHEDVKDILHFTRYKFGINDFDIKGFSNNGKNDN